MKKIVFTLASLMISTTSFAAADYTQELSGGQQNTVYMSDCALLANDIKIAVSSNAVAGFACNETTSTAAISVCHTKGLKIERSSEVTKDDSGAAICTVSSTEKCIDTVTGSAFPTASTTDGTVNSRYPGVSCSAGEAVKLADGNT